MTVTFVLPFVNVTGGIRVLLDYANWLHDEGHHVSVIYPLWPYRFHFSRRDQLSEFRRARRTAVGVPWLPLRCRLHRVPVIANSFMPRADLIVATSWPVAESVARLDPSRGRKVHIVFHHETGTGPEKRIIATYGLPFHRVSFSPAVRELMREQFACEIHQIVPAAVNPALFFEDGTRSASRVLMLYHNDPRKGAADGIAALTRLRAHRPNLEFLLCGSVRPCDLPSWIRFEFHPADADLRRMYSESTVFLYPSRNEGFGLPPLEAMACGCPVVTTSVGAVPEFARHERNAMVVKPGDVDGMVTAVEALLADSAKRATLSRLGRATAEGYALARSAPLFRTALERSLSEEGSSL